MSYDFTYSPLISKCSKVVGHTLIFFCPLRLNMIYTTTEQDSRDAACMLFKAVQWDNISRDGTESEVDGMSLFEVLPRALVTPFPHDPGGRLLEMGMRAHEIVLAMHDQDTDSETRVGVYMQAMELRKRELAGWLAVRTPEYPEGDLLGAARVPRRAMDLPRSR